MNSRASSRQPVLYIDMDNVIVDFASGIERLDPTLRERFKSDLDDAPGIFALMSPMDGAIESVRLLCTKFDTYVLSTSPWANPTAWSDKLLWIQHHFGAGEDSPLYKRLILTHHKNLNEGAYLIDDRTQNGAEDFRGTHIQFGQPQWPDWATVTEYLMSI